MSIKHRVFEILEASQEDDRLSRVVDLSILGLIALSVIAVLLETVRPVYQEFASAFRTFEVFSVSVFSIEYVLRVWSCTENPRYEHPLYGRLRFIVSPMGLIDLLAIAPFYVASYMDLRILRALRLFRLFRIAKVTRYSSVLNTFGRVLRAKKEELVIMLSFTVMLLLISSAVMYLVENPAQPEKFSSIPTAMWWGITTLTTVGYGDAYPVTPLGKILASVIAVMGIGLFALPAGILGSAFMEDLQHRKKHRSSSCPHCGKELEA